MAIFHPWSTIAIDVILFPLNRPDDIRLFHLRSVNSHCFCHFSDFRHIANPSQEHSYLLYRTYMNLIRFYSPLSMDLIPAWIKKIKRCWPNPLLSTMIDQSRVFMFRRHFRERSRSCLWGKTRILRWGAFLLGGRYVSIEIKRKR